MPVFVCRRYKHEQQSAAVQRLHLNVWTVCLHEQSSIFLENFLITHPRLHAQAILLSQVHCTGSNTLDGNKESRLEVYGRVSAR